MEKITKKLINNQISEFVERKIWEREHVLSKFLDLLFWKDYNSGYLSPELQREVISIMDTAFINGPEGETWIDYDNKKALIIANKIREKIKLPTLKFEHGVLSEEPNTKDQHQKCEICDKEMKNTICNKCINLDFEDNKK